jgi:glycosyltransferase involved in cell wall biosynthesis
MRQGHRPALLVLTPTFPYPPTSGGDIRVFHLLRRLARSFDVHLLSLCEGPDRPLIEQTGIAMVYSIDGGAKVLAGRNIRQRLNFWRYSPHGLSLEVDPAYAHTLKQLVANTHFDAVLVEHLYMLQYARFVCPSPVFLSAHNVETMKFSRWFANEPLSLKRRWLHRAQQAVIRFYESSLARRTSAVFATSPVDGDLLRRMNRGRGRFVVAPNGADFTFFEPRSRESFDRPPAILFMGTLYYRPNYEAALYLANEIFPRVRQEIPEAECHLVGRTDRNDYSHLAAPERGVHMHGFVDDVRPHVLRCQVSVVPLRVGSGTRIKIIEAMATATPVVSTSIGAEGLSCTDGENIVIKDTPVAMAKAVVHLLRDRELCVRIGAAGRRLVEKEYGWDASAEVMRGEIMRVIGSVGAGSA